MGDYIKSILAAAPKTERLFGLVYLVLAAGVGASARRMVAFTLSRNDVLPYSHTSRTYGLSIRPVKE